MAIEGGRVMAGNRNRAFAGLWVVLAGALFFNGCAGDESAPTPSPSPATSQYPPLGEPASAVGLRSITEAELRAAVTYLASPELAGRGSGSGGDVLAAQYIAQQFAQVGLWPEGGEDGFLQPFRINVGSGETFNVVGTLPGMDAGFADEPLVVGAHYDHVGVRNGAINPGADDNASGTAALMEIAEALTATGALPRRPVILAAFGGEELGLLGSREWVQKRFPGGATERPILMLNADMIGHVATGHLRALGVSSDDPLATALRAIALRHPVGEVWFIDNAGGGSDHVPFVALGVPVAFFHTGTHDLYHTPGDTAGTLDYVGLTEATRVIYELAWNVANVKRLPTLAPPMAPADDHWLIDHGLRPFLR